MRTLPPAAPLTWCRCSARPLGAEAAALRRLEGAPRLAAQQKALAPSGRIEDRTGAQPRNYRRGCAVEARSWILEDHLHVAMHRPEAAAAGPSVHSPFRNTSPEGCPDCAESCADWLPSRP